MKKCCLFICSLVLLGACRQEDRWSDLGEGTLLLDMQAGEEVKVVSRAEDGETAGEEIQNPADLLKETARVRVYQGNKLIRKYEGWGGEVESGITLASGDGYRVRVTAGDSVAASFESKYYVGEETFAIAKGRQTEVDVTCNIANALVKVNFADVLDDYLESAEVTVSVDAEGGSLAYRWAGGEEAAEAPVGYYTFPQDKKYFVCTLTCVTKSGKKFAQTDRIEDAEESTLYTLTYNYVSGGDEPEASEQGGGFFELEVDETPLVKKEESVDVYQRPVIQWTNGGAVLPDGEAWTLEPGTDVTPVTVVAGSSALSQVAVEGTLLAALGITPSGDLLDEAFRSELQNKGIVVTIDSESRLTVNWNASLNVLFETEGIHELTFAAMDGNGKSRETALRIIVSDSNVRAVPIPHEYEIWGDKATLYAEVIEGKNPTGTLTFRYRRKGTDNWTEGIAAVREDDQIKSAQLTGLTPGTTYEYQVVEDTKVSDIVQEFTTEAAVQLPNAGFEDWHQSGNTWYIYPKGGEMFWDSGNYGSTTGFAALMPTNMTTAGTDYFHNGKSVRMETADILGNIAAGNIFIGQFLGTENTTKGILGWGRKFENRPLALRGYVRYVPGDYTGDDKRLPDGKDRGIIYIAVGDWAGASYNANWPIVIRTLYPDTDLFDKTPGTYTGDGIIAYGERVLTTEVTGKDGGMVKFTIPLEYRSNERIPTAIVLVASASQYGDYMLGAEGSTMWLDDLELIYEESKLEK